MPDCRTHVCFVPFDGGNPYQRELARHLRSFGVAVTPLRSLKGLAALTRSRTADGPDVVHLHWLPRVEVTPTGALAVLLFVARIARLRLRGVRIVWTVHNLYHHEARWRPADRWLARRVAASASRVIVHSTTAHTLVSREFGVDDDKLAVVPHGHYADSYPNTTTRLVARARLGLDADSVVLLFFGNLRPYKGVRELVAAYQALDNRGTTLLIVGKPSSLAVVSAVERAMTSCARIQLRTGFVPEEDVQTYMNASDVVVLPYQDVLTSGALVLAMSFGRACIAPAMGCIPDMLDERGGFLYGPGQDDALREALRRAIAQRERLHAMGMHNLQRVREWGWDRVARDTAAVYAAAPGHPNAREVVGAHVVPDGGS